MEEAVHAATVPGALQCSLIALRGSLFDATVVAFLRRPCCGEMGALGGDVCARVVESMWRWSLVDDRTLPVVVSLSAHFGADWHGHLSLTDCPHVSKQVLDRTARLWRNIATIDASDTRVDDDFLECLGESPAAGMLLELNLSECVGITTEGLRALRAFPRLRRLDLSGNSLLGDVLFPSLDLRGSDRETQDRSERFLHRLALASLPGHVDNCELGTQGIGAPPMPLPRLTELRLEFPPLSLLELLQQSGRLGRFEVLGRSDHVIHPSGVKLRRRAERIAAAAAMDQPPQPTETAASRQDQILEALWDARRLRNGSVELRPEFTRRLLDRLRRGDETAEAGFRWENLVLAVDQPGPRGLEILAHFPHLRQLSLLPDVGDDEALLVSTTTTTTTPRSDNDNEAPTGNESFGASFEALTGLRELFVSQPEAVFTGHQRLTAAAWSSILSTLPNLTSLVVLDRCRHSLLSALGSAGLSSLTSLKLRGLRLGHHGSDDALPLSRALWESLEALPSLRQVDLGVDTQLWTHAPVDDDNGRDDSGGAVEHLVRHTGLEAFRMYGPGDTRLRLTCPQLRSCHLNFYPLRDLLGLVDDLVAHSPLLEDLQVNGIDASTPQSSRSDDGAWLGRLLVGLPRLRLLSLTGRTPRSDAGAVASLLGGTSLLLGELDLDCVIDTASLDVVLGACPRLHTLHLAAYRDPAHERAADGPSPDLLLPRTTLPALRYLALGPLRSGQAENNESEDENDPSRRLDLAAVAPHVQKVVLHQVHATKVVVSAGCDALCSLSVWQRSRIAVEVAQARRLRKLALAVDDASTLEVADCPALASLNIMANGYSARLRITRLDGCPALANVTAYGELMSVDAALAAVRSAHSRGISNT